MGLTEACACPEVSDEGLDAGCICPLLGQAPVVADGDSSPPPMLRSRQKCKSSPTRGLLLEHFPFEEDGKILSSSDFICEPAGFLRGFKLINQSADIELNLYLGLETLRSALNGKEPKGWLPCPRHSPRLPALAGELAVSSITQPL